MTDEQIFARRFPRRYELPYKSSDVRLDENRNSRNLLGLKKILEIQTIDCFPGSSIRSEEQRGISHWRTARFR